MTLSRDCVLAGFGFGIIEIAITQNRRKTSFRNHFHNLSNVGNGRYVDQAQCFGNLVRFGRDNPQFVLE